MKGILTTEKLNVWYNGLHALIDVSIRIPQCKITALIGASGSGKSTFLRSLNRMLDMISNSTVQGKVFYNSENSLESNTDVVTLRRAIGMVFQNPTPFPKSIYDNVAYGVEIQGTKNKHHRFLGLIKPTITGDEIEHSDDPLDRIVVRSLQEAALWEEVKDRLFQSAFRLSGGQQQRLCIARAIAVRPKILLLDEPCSDLDPLSTRKIEELLLRLKKNYTIVIVTHNIHQAKRISDYVGFFHLGKLIEIDTSAKMFSNPKNALTKQYIQGYFG